MALDKLDIAGVEPGTANDRSLALNLQDPHLRGPDGAILSMGQGGQIGLHNLIPTQRETATHITKALFPERFDMPKEMHTQSSLFQAGAPWAPEDPWAEKTGNWLGEQKEA